MNCFLTQLHSLEGNATEKLFYSSERRLLATTGQDGSMKIYAISADEFHLTLLKDIRDHHAPIMSVQFAPLMYKTYILSVGYDKEVHLYSLEEMKSTNPQFSYAEEKKEIGFFSAAAFVQMDKTRLVFVVGSSTGDILVFDSVNNFEPTYAKPVPGFVKSISANAHGQIAMSITGRGVLIFNGLDFANPIEFGAEVHTNNKVASVAWAPAAPFDTERVLFTVGEDDKLAIWRFDAESSKVTLETKFELGANIIGAFWNLSGYSITVLLGKKGEEGLGAEVVNLAKSIDGTQNSWSFSPVNIIS
jgi:WD40 repeat protein